MVVCLSTTSYDFACSFGSGIVRSHLVGMVMDRVSLLNTIKLTFIVLEFVLRIQRIVKLIYFLSGYVCSCIIFDVLVSQDILVHEEISHVCFMEDVEVVSV